MDHPKHRTPLLGTRRRKAVAAALMLLALPAAALAAWTIWSGIQGSSSGKFAAASTNKALEIKLKTVPTLNNDDTAVPVVLSVKNLEPVGGASHSLTSVTGTVTTVPTQCAASVVFTPPDLAGITTIIAPGQTKDVVNGTIRVASSAPIACQNGDWSIAFNGTEAVAP